MRPRRLTPPVRRTTRRWRTPPAILSGGEAFEGAGILEELPDPLAALLFQAVRDVYLWARTEPEARAGLFAPRGGDALVALLREGAAEVPLQSPLMTLARMADAPERASAEDVAVACGHVAAWADGRGWLGTALAFAQGAAVALPGEAAASYSVGRLARRRAEHARAETWYRRAVALARQSGDWTTYAMAFAGLGNLYAQRGSLPAARRFHLRALRAARRHSLRPLQATALHDLFVIAAQAGHADEAERLAREAFEAYGGDHPRLLFLAADVGYFWMEQGRFAPALTVLQALAPHMHRQEDRTQALANIARAAAGAGDRGLFAQAWDEVWHAAARAPASENAATVMLELAHGAATLGEHDRAEEAAARAVDAARARGEARTRLAAESVLDQVRRARGLRPRAEADAPFAEPAAEAHRFARDLVRILNAALVAR